MGWLAFGGGDTALVSKVPRQKEPYLSSFICV